MEIPNSYDLAILSLLIMVKFCFMYFEAFLLTLYKLIIVIAFHHCDKISDKISLLKKKGYFGSWFLSFQSMATDSVVLGLWQHSTSWQEHGQRDVFSLPDNQEAKEERRGWVPLSLSRAHP
jgi:hypothetical protein